jgi:hypothetical protein
MLDSPKTNNPKLALAFDVGCWMLVFWGFGSRCSRRCAKRQGHEISPGLTIDSKGIGHKTIKRVDERAEQWLNPSRQMKRELKPEEHEEIVKAIAAGDRVKATSLYLSATEGDLTSAQNFIKTLIVEKQAAQSQQSAKERD